MTSVCLIRQGHYPIDARVSREVDALAGAGYDVDVICARWPDQPAFERDGRISVYRLPIPRRRGRALGYVSQYGRFLIAATWLATKMHLRRGYRLVQVNSLPDSLVFAAALPRLLGGARILLDLQESMPDFFATKYGLAPRHPLVRIITLVEQVSIRFADSVITCTDQMRERFVERGGPADKIGVVMTSTNEKIFRPVPTLDEARSRDRFVLVYHGTIEEEFGVDTAVRAVALLRHEIPGLRLEVYGDGMFRPAIEALVHELGVEDRVHLARAWVPYPELVSAIAAADAGVVPTKRDAFRDLTLANKMFDLIAMRKPAIVGRTRAVEAHFDDSSLQLFEPGDERDLARAIRGLYADPARRERLVQRATEVNEPYRWLHQRKRYLAIVERLVARDRDRGREPAVPAEVGELS